ncbi:YvqE [Flavobacteriales bacterium ALC-1]|nr:YvqE [Flavobacteriales bacterium ALC-1]
MSQNESVIVKENDSLALFKLIEKYKSSKSESCLFKALDIEFGYYIKEKQLDKSSQLLTKQETVLSRLNCTDEFLYNIYFNKALYYRAKNDYEKLSENIFKALTEAERIKDDEKQIEAIKQVVHLFTRMRESHKNWAYIKRAEKLIFNQQNSIKSIGNYRWLAFVYEHEYTTTERKTLIDSTILFINKAKKEAFKHNIDYEIAQLYRALEACSYHKGELENAVVYIDSAIYYAKKIKGVKNIGPLYLSKAWDHLDLGQFNEAEKWADTAISYDNQNKGTAAYMMLLSSTSEIYEGAGNLDKAFKSYKSYSKIKDSILKLDRVKVVNELETKYKTEIKDAKIKRLTVLLIIATLGILSLLLIGALVRLRQSRKQNEALRIAFEKQIQLEKELSDVRDEIAQDFHDDLGNKLARISLLSNLVSGEVSINDPKVKSKIIQITEDANGLYKGTRDFVFSLKSNSDYIEEIATYLSDFGEDFFSKTKIKFVVDKQISSNIKLPHYWNKQLVFIFKEAITNTLKHSNCTEVILKFNYGNGQLLVECIDNGIGIDEDAIKSSNGLSNMKNRAKKISGKLFIVSKLDEGTTIRFKGNTN